MAERRENSVLFSLRELRQIEDERVQQEESERLSQVEAERRAKEEAERLALEAAERKKRDEEERVIKHQQEKERQIREEQLRLQESERRAQIEAAAQLEAARMQAEIHAKAVAKKTPVGLIIGIVGAVVLIAGGGAMYMVNESQKKADAAVAAVTAELDRAKKQNEKVLGDLSARLSQTQDAAEKAKIEAAIAAEKAKQAEQMRALEAKAATVTRKPSGGGSAKPKPAGDTKPKCDPNDPLCGAGELK